MVFVRNTRNLMLVSAVMISVHATAAPLSVCDAVLIPSTTEITSSTRIKWSVLKLVTEKDYSEWQKNGKAKVPGYFDGDWSDFQKKQKDFFNRVNLNYSEDQARSILQTRLEDEQIKGWVECHRIELGKTREAKLLIAVRRATTESATIHAQWVPGAGLPEIKIDRVDVTSGKWKGFRHPFLGRRFSGDKMGILLRSPGGNDVQGIIQGTAGDSGSFVENFYIPKAPSTIAIQYGQVFRFGSVAAHSFSIPPFPSDTTLGLTVTTKTRFPSAGGNTIGQRVTVNGLLSNLPQSPAGAEGAHVQVLNVPVKKDQPIEISIENVFSSGGQPVEMEASIGAWYKVTQ